MTFEEFVASELPSLTRYARVLTGDRHDAHDVLADALVTAHQRWKRIGRMAHPTAYVRRIVTTTFLARKRRWSTRHIRLTRSGQPPEPAPTGPLLEPTRRIDDREQLHHLLARLPDRQRAALVLRYFLDLSDAEIARELQCAQATVRSLVSRGLAALRIATDPTTDTATGSRTSKGTPANHQEAS